MGRNRKQVFSQEGLSPGEDNNGPAKAGHIVNQRLVLGKGQFAPGSLLACCGAAMDAMEIAFSGNFPGKHARNDLAGL
jgi:hypothetical protein